MTTNTQEPTKESGVKIEYAKPKGTYWSTLADGKFHSAVDEGTEGAIRREYETSDGKKGVKHELVAQAISGKISNITLYDGDYGRLLQVTLGQDKDAIILSLATASNFGEDFMKKLPNINLEKDIRVAPYSFEDDKGKKRRGVTIYQDEQKLADFYHQKDGDKIVSINGYPEVPKKAEKWSKDEWKVYFAQARIFLCEQVEKHSLYNKVTLADGKKVEYPKEESADLDIPF